MNSRVHNLCILVYLFLTEVELLEQRLYVSTAFNKYCCLQKAHYHLHSRWQSMSACLPFTSPSFLFLPALCDLQEVSFPKQGWNPEIESLES